ncbi:hypothetical protein MMC13_001464 [Lambiella insularis]|nr:hypothetical protein [Lambiella insularis]
MNKSTTSTSPGVPARPSSMYFHTGIGGRGNYRKCEADTAAASSRLRGNARVHFPRSFRSLFSNGARQSESMPPVEDVHAGHTLDEVARARARERSLTLQRFVGVGGMAKRHSCRVAADSLNETDEGYSGQALPYGAADIIKRKVGAVLGMKKTRDEDTVDMEKSFYKSLQDGIQA